MSKIAYIVSLYMKGCICHFKKWQIHPFISKGTICLVQILEMLVARHSFKWYGYINLIAYHLALTYLLLTFSSWCCASLIVLVGHVFDRDCWSPPFNMTTDDMMAAKLMMSANNHTDPSPLIIAGIKDAGIKLCYTKMDLPLLPRIILTILLLISVVGHLLVIIVCVRERNKATYKQDIVYMVALAIVDMIFCLSILLMRPSVRHIVALKTLLPLLLCMSLVLMALRAVERFKIIIRKQAKPWSSRFQIILCLVSNLFVAVPIN